MASPGSEYPAASQLNRESRGDGELIGAAKDTGMEEKVPHRVSWEEYRSWEGDERWEVIEGVPYLMGSPRCIHQELVGSFHYALRSALRGHRCQPYLSPLDVKLSEYDVVQPDLLILCDGKQRQETHIEGAPALVIEILSPSSERHDRLRKLRLYARAGVPEYWIVKPDPALLEVLVLDGDSYRIHAVHGETGRVVSPTLPVLDLSLAELFEPALPGEVEEVREVSPEYFVRT